PRRRPRPNFRERAKLGARASRTTLARDERQTRRANYAPQLRAHFLPSAVCHCLRNSKRFASSNPESRSAETGIGFTALPSSLLNPAPGRFRVMSVPPENSSPSSAEMVGPGLERKKPSHSLPALGFFAFFDTKASRESTRL